MAYNNGNRHGADGADMMPNLVDVSDIRVRFYQGFPIYHRDSGYYWQEGGYFDTIQECMADIESANQDVSRWA